jgi:hypothetical protein
MGETIRDGTGNSYEAKVDSENRLYARAVTVANSEQAALDGRAFNINTGKISLTGADESAILYFKNDEDSDFIIDAIAIGVSNGTTADIGELTFVIKPTGGDIISDASVVDMKGNRNAGSATTLKSTTLVYKGKDGGTVTGGTDGALFFQGDNGRLFATFEFVVQKGSAVALKYDPNLSSGSVNVYAALIGHIREADE